MAPIRPHVLIAAVAVAVGLVVTGCSDEDVDATREELEDVTGAVGARSVAESLRAALKAKDLAGGENLRDVATLRDAAADLPGDPEIVGVDDADGDGRDDDGKVEVRTGDQAACVTVAEDGDDVDIADGACA